MMEIIRSEFDEISGVYCIKNHINNKCYVGSSKNVYNRLLKHRATLRSNVHQNQYLQNSWNKYDENNFTCFILERTDLDNMIEREEYWISIFGEYNSVKTPVKIIFSDETKVKMSNSRREGIANGTIPKYGTKKVSQFTLNGDYIRTFDSLTDVRRTLDISQDQIRRCCTGESSIGKGYLWRYGVEEESIKPYIKPSHDMSKLNKQILVLDLYTGITVEYKSIGHCAKDFNLCSPSISWVLNNSKTKIYKNRYFFQVL